MAPRSKSATDSSAAAQHLASESSVLGISSEDVQRAAAKRADAATRQPDDGMVAALLQERRGYVQRGLDGRVAQVDEQLAKHGYAGGE